jgi:hypothetical protein
MLKQDPIPWLMAQDGAAAVRARRLLGLDRDGDASAVRATEERLDWEQFSDGSFEQSPMATAGVLVLLADLRAGESDELIDAASSYLLSVLESQPGYERARGVAPASLTEPCDLSGFFGPYEHRGRPDVMAFGAREMNFYRQYEPLLGPKSEVRTVRRSSLDRAGPSSCYAWGLIPLCYTIEALGRAGRERDARLRPATNALLGAQRVEDGGWCRSLGGGHPSCTLPAVRALGAHPHLRASQEGERALEFMADSYAGKMGGGMKRCWSGSKLFAALQALAPFDHPAARTTIREGLAALAPRQQKNGSFGGPARVERVAAVLAAQRAQSDAPVCPAALHTSVG